MGNSVLNTAVFRQLLRLVRKVGLDKLWNFSHIYFDGGESQKTDAGTADRVFADFAAKACRMDRKQQGRHFSDARSGKSFLSDIG